MTKYVFNYQNAMECSHTPISNLHGLWCRTLSHRVNQKGQSKSKSIAMQQPQSMFQLHRSALLLHHITLSGRVASISTLHIGHLLLEVNHWSTQSRWNRCKQGSRLQRHIKREILQTVRMQFHSKPYMASVPLSQNIGTSIYTSS